MKTFKNAKYSCAQSALQPFSIIPAAIEQRPATRAMLSTATSPSLENRGAARVRLGVQSKHLCSSPFERVLDKFKSSYFFPAIRDEGQGMRDEG